VYDPFADSLPVMDPRYLSTAEPMQMVDEAAFGMAYLRTLDDTPMTDSLTKEFVHSFLTFLVVHEVGHTLGFRHNFIASTAFTSTRLTILSSRKRTARLGR